MADKKNLAEFVFGAEDNSAASIDNAKLKKYNATASMMFNTRVLTAKEMTFPAIAEFATRVMGGLNVYQTLYFVSVLKIDMVYIAAIQALIAIYNYLNDPLMGIVYDKTRTRWGKARPYLLLTPLPYFATTALLYSGALFLTSDKTDDPKKIVFVFLVLFAQETFSTIYSLPRGNITSLLTPNPQDRITMNLVGNYLGTLGSELVVLIFMPLQDLNRWGLTNVSMPLLFAVLGWICAGVGVIGNMAMGLGCRERIMLQSKPAPLTKSLFYMFKNKYMARNFIAGMFTSWLNSGNYSWDVVTQLEIFGGAFKSMFFYMFYHIFNPLSVLLIPKFQKFFKYNNKRAMITMRIWDLICNLCKWGIGRFFVDKWWAVGLIFGFFYGLDAFNNAPSEVFGGELGREIGDYTEYVTGERPDGTINLLPNLIRTTTAPLKALMTIKVFKWSGYDPTIPMAPWSQGSKVVYRKVLFLYCAFECIPRFIETIPYFFYDITGEKREKMYIELNARRALIAEEKTVSDEMQSMLDMLEAEDKGENK